MKIVTIELTQAIENYLTRIRTVLPETLAREPDEKLIPILMEQGALVIENIPDELLKSFVNDLGDTVAKKMQNPDSQTIVLPNH